MEERGEITSGQKILLKQALHKKIDYYLRKPSLDAVQVYNLVKDFFKAYFSSEMEFTREDILHRLDKVYLDDNVKSRLGNLVRILGRVEFSHPRYEDDELREYLQEFSELADILVHAETVTIGFWDRIAKKFFSKFRKTEDKPKEEKLSPLEEFLIEADKEYNGEAAGKPEKAGMIKYTKQKTVHNPMTKKKDMPGEKSIEEPPLYKPAQEASPQPQEDSEGEQHDIHFKPGSDDYDEGTPETEDDVVLANFNELLQRFYASMAMKDKSLAVQLYGELKQAYEKLGQGEKPKYYDKLLSAYNEISEDS